MSAVLDSIVQDVNVEGPAFKEPNPLLLQRATALASFSLQAYDNLETESAAGAPIIHSARLLDVQEVGPAHSGSQSGQYRIWDVEGLGMVVAFRGTMDVFDALTDLSCRPTELRGMPADDVVMLHSGIYLSVLSGCARIETAYGNLVSKCSTELKAPPSLFLTGAALLTHQSFQATT